MQCGPLVSPFGVIRRNPSRMRVCWPAILALVAAVLGLPATAVAQATYEVVASFESPTPNGSNPGGLLQGSDGNLYGVTQSGGAFGFGTIFKIDAAATLTTLHNFAASTGGPWYSLIQASDGSLYGTTPQGGASNLGTVFKLDSAGTLTTLHSFAGDDGARPSALIQASDGNLYGTTRSGGTLEGGTVFKLDAAGTPTTLYRFGGGDEGSGPVSLIQASDGSFYGTTDSSSGWTVFKLDQTGTLTTLSRFSQPPTSLIQGIDGSFYGTTGRYSRFVPGTLFKLDAAGTLTTLHLFPGEDPSNLIQVSDGTFYGTTSGSVFKLDTAGTLAGFHGFTEGRSPTALIQGSDGNLYGTTYYGGADGAGIAFKLDTAGTLTTLQTFGLSDHAFSPSGVMQGSDESFYGTTSLGGPGSGGTVFKLDAARMLTTLHSFTYYLDSATPFGPLIQPSDGNVYGTMFFGGPERWGTVFKLDAAGTLTTLYGFAGYDGAGPVGLIQGRDGNLYVTNSQGGVGEFATGTLVRLDAAGTLTILYSFTRGDGARPVGLTQASDGSFWGATQEGGADDLGTVFRLDASGTLTTLHSFAGFDGATPLAPLIQTSDGNVYGTTSIGGTGGGGTVFKLDASGTLTTLHSFAGDDGSGPVGLIQGSDGNLYGTTRGGGADDLGTVFRLDAAGALTTIHSFAGDDGARPFSGMIEASDGSFYGTASEGGPRGGGVVFRLTVGAATTTTLTTSPNPSRPGQSVTLTATVSAAGDTPTGSVEFFDEATSLGIAALAGGSASLDVTTLVAGTHRLTAHYLGNPPWFLPGVAAAVDQLVTALNHAPVARHDRYAIDANTALTVPIPGVLGNDRDADGDGLTVTLVSTPAHGAVVLAADGSFTYTPVAGYRGLDRFTYQATDGDAVSNVATVSVRVTGPVLTLFPRALRFAPQIVGVPGAPHAVFVRNSGTGPLVITSIAVTGADPRDFAQTTTCTRAIAPGGHCVIRVTFVPTEAGWRTAALTITPTPGTEARSIRVTGKGERRRSPH